MNNEDCDGVGCGYWYGLFASGDGRGNGIGSGSGDGYGGADMNGWGGGYSDGRGGSGRIGVLDEKFDHLEMNL